MDKLRILLADDHKVMRRGLRLLIDEQPDMDVVGEADDGHGAVALALDLQPDIVVMDVSMPRLNGLKATEKLKGLFPKVKVITLTRHADDGYLQQLLRAGISGYVLKQSPSDELLRAIRAVAGGQTYLDPAITEQVIVGKRAIRGVHAVRELSPREGEILRLIAWGHLNKEIAARLKISIKTVETHKASAMAKLGMNSRIDIVRYALLQGWLEDA
jgi:DNA-binding NarL/FixJ family response regulator